MKIEEILKDFVGVNPMLNALAKAIYNKTYGRWKWNKISKRIKRDFWDIQTDIFEVTKDRGFDVWVAFGTLLGIYRDGGPIPGDPDMDFAAWYDDRDTVRQGLERLGFELHTTYRCDDCAYPAYEEAYMRTGVKVDIFYFHKTETSCLTYLFLRMPTSRFDKTRNQITGMTVKEITFPKFDVIESTDYKVPVHVPTDIPAHLEARYGPSFLVPDPTWSEPVNNVKSHSGSAEFSS
tara:strand:- start:8113 stop:8817 length:705 start_codon:yes stop_codon:yes gene_type:complete